MRYLRLYKYILLLLILIPFASCSSYKEIVIDNKVILSGVSSGYSFTNSESEKKPEFKSVKQKSLLIKSAKYLACLNNFTPEAKIMNRGVDETIRGNYIEAEILFNEIKDNINDGAVENNLAVIYELTKRKKNAMEMYTNALIKSPDNPQFKSNLLSFINHNKYKIGN